MAYPIEKELLEVHIRQLDEAILPIVMENRRQSYQVLLDILQGIFYGWNGKPRGKAHKAAHNAIIALWGDLPHNGRGRRSLRRILLDRKAAVQVELADKALVNRTDGARPFGRLAGQFNGLVHYADRAEQRRHGWVEAVDRTSEGG